MQGSSFASRNLDARALRRTLCGLATAAPDCLGVSTSSLITFSDHWTSLQHTLQRSAALPRAPRMHALGMVRGAVGLLNPARAALALLRPVAPRADRRRPGGAGPHVERIASLQPPPAAHRARAALDPENRFESNLSKKQALQAQRRGRSILRRGFVGTARPPSQAVAISPHAPSLLASAPASPSLPPVPAGSCFSPDPATHGPVPGRDAFHCCHRRVLPHPARRVGTCRLMMQLNPCCLTKLTPIRAGGLPPLPVNLRVQAAELHRPQ